MDETEAAELLPADEADKKYLTVRQAAFIGVGAMVGAGIFALLGAADKAIQLRRQSKAVIGASAELKAGPAVQVST